MQKSLKNNPPVEAITRPQLPLRAWLRERWSDKKRQKKFWALFQLFICCLISFPLEITSIVFMFRHPVIAVAHLGDATYQQTLYTNFSGQLAFQWISLILVSFVIGYGGWKYFKNAFNETFRWKQWGMSTLITLSVIVAYCFSFYPLIQDTVWMAHLHEGSLDATGSFRKTGMLASFFPTAAIVITIATIGGYITTSLKLKANDDLTALTSLQVSEAYRKEGTEIKQVPVKQLQVNDVVVVYKNTLIPIDGRLLSEKTLVNEATITGESRPVLKTTGDSLIGSTTNLGETFEMVVTTTSKDSVIAGIIKNVRKIQSQKPKYQKIADRISFWFIPIVVTISILTFFLHAFVPGFNEALHNYTFDTNGHQPLSGAVKFISAVYAAVAILVVACPCSLGLAVPLALVIATSRSAKNGIMITRAEAYERVKHIDVIAFDKTGTLTRGEFEVREWLATADQLHLLYTLEQRSLHPLARSFQTFYDARFGMDAWPVSNLAVVETAGVGMEATAPDGTVYRATSLKYVRTNHFVVPDAVAAFINRYEVDDQFVSFICLTRDQVLVAVVVLCDDLNQNAADTIKIFQRQGIKTCLISGDAEIATRNIAHRLGMDAYYAEVSPEQKAEIVAKLREGGKVVAFVGDGINDIIAMKQADLAISFSKENAVANAITDVSILNKNVFSVYKAIRIVQGTRKNIIWNICWSFIYNSILIPLTVLGYVPPYVAACAMMCSEIVIVTTTIIFKNVHFRIISKSLFRELDNPDLQERI